MGRKRSAETDITKLAVGGDNVDSDGSNQVCCPLFIHRRLISTAAIAGGARM
jgi:hypothetical protein